MVLSVTSHIHFELRLLGGEPLLNRKAAQMLLYSLEHPKAEGHGEITQNRNILFFRITGYITVYR